MIIDNPTREQQIELIERNGFVVHVHFIKDVPNLIAMMAEFSIENYKKHNVASISCFCTIADLDANAILHGVVRHIMNGCEMELYKKYEIFSNNKSVMMVDYQKIKPSNIFHDPMYKSILVISDENHKFPWEEGYANKYKSVLDDIYNKETNYN